MAGAAIAPLAAARRARIDLALASGERGAAWSPTGTLAEVGGGWPPASGSPDDEGRREALRMLTLGPARAAGRGGDTGCLEKGCRADFVIVSRDPLVAPATRVDPVRVLSTWLDGRAIFTATR